jgi:hypothetical protein
MASVIHATAHGLVAGSRIKFGNVVPGDTGIDEAKPYYVLASGLTADDFQFSEEAGGAAFVLAFAITDGVVINDITYEETVLVGPGLITETHIAPDSISTPMLQANIITAEKMAAIMVLATKFMTAESGRRGEFDLDGFRLYESDGSLLVNMPTTGDPVFFNAEVLASSLTVDGDSEFRGVGLFAAGSVTTLASQISNPSAAPALAQDWDTITMPADATYDESATVYYRHGLSYHADGGAGGATKVFWTTNIGVTNWYALELLASDRTVNRAIDMGSNAGIGTRGAVKMGSHVYVMSELGLNGYTVKKFLNSDLSLVSTFTNVPPNPSDTLGAIDLCTDGTNLFVVWRSGADGQVHWRKYDSSLALVGSEIDTGWSTGAGQVRAAAAGSFDLGAFRIAAKMSDGQVELFDSTGARQANEQFPCGTSGNGSGLTYGDALGDGARFWSASNMKAGSVVDITKHTTWVWTTASSVYWVAYSWYDSAGTTHESQCGPRASTTMGRRKRLTVTCAALPGAGGAEDPDNHRIYILPNATDPGLTALKLQATTVGNATVLTTYSSGGAADPGANGFGAGTPGILQSGTAGFQIKGSGLIDFGGSSFPANPTTGDHYFRTDLLKAGGWFRYDGTRWRSTAVFDADMGGTNEANALAVTTNNTGWAPLDLRGGSDAWLLESIVYLYTNTGGAAYNGTNKWAFVIDKNTVATFTTLHTVTINSGANAGRQVTTAIDALANNGTVHQGFRYSSLKTGTPGAIFASVKISYQIVAT